MSSLTEPFPVSLTISGVECPIHWDFRTVLRCQKILQDAGRELTEDEMTRLLRLFYGQYTWYTEEHFDKMLWFFSCGREPERKHFPRKIAGINGDRDFSFYRNPGADMMLTKDEVDADLIYAAFIQQYGIDLQTEEMHWWKFMILLENLGGDTRFQKIMEYRTLDLSAKGLSKDQKRFYQAMQEYYGLDTEKAPDKAKLKALEEALERGEDVSELLKGW